MKYPMEPASALTPIVAGAIYNQMTGILIHGPIMGEEWIESLKLDKSGDSWMTKDHARDMRSCSWKEFILNFARALATSMLLQTTHTHSMSQAAQLGMMLFLGVHAPQMASELLWEKRPYNLQKIKLLTGFSATVMMTCLVYWIGTFH